MAEGDETHTIAKVSLPRDLVKQFVDAYMFSLPGLPAAGVAAAAAALNAAIDENPDLTSAEKTLVDNSIEAWVNAINNGTAVPSWNFEPDPQ